jgi:two-component system, OmpR family, sensor histidine kinase BaeS
MRRRGGWPIWWRVALTCVAVTLFAVLIVAGISAWLGDRYVRNLVNERRDDLTRSLVVTAASTYNTGKPTWSDVDLRPALDLAAKNGTEVAVLDANGKVVATTFTDPQHAPNTSQHPIIVTGQPVGTLYLRFNGRGLEQSADNLRRALLHAQLGAAAIATMLALVAAVAVSRRLSIPVRTLTAAASAMSRGNRDARVGPLKRAPAELQELATTFDDMADTLSRGEQLRRDVVADVAHELRTPVAILQANTEALLDGVVERTPEQIASLHEEVVRLARMVADLQELASAEAAALHLQKAPCDLAMIVEVVVDSLQPTFIAGQLAVRCHLTPAVINGDPVRLHQITTNLLANAVKFTAPGGALDVTVTTARGLAILAVRDTGCGIPAEDLPHVFKRFWRGDAGAATPGTGIGLAIVADLVAAHGGGVTLVSTVGKGTCVTVTLPLATAA